MKKTRGKYRRQDKAIHKKNRSRLVIVLSCIAAFITTYMLVLPAITLEQKNVSRQMPGMDAGSGYLAEYEEFFTEEALTEGEEDFELSAFSDYDADDPVVSQEIVEGANLSELSAEDLIEDDADDDLIFDELFMDETVQEEKQEKLTIGSELEGADLSSEHVSAETFPKEEDQIDDLTGREPKEKKPLTVTMSDEAAKIKKAAEIETETGTEIIEETGIAAESGIVTETADNEEQPHIVIENLTEAHSGNDIEITAEVPETASYEVEQEETLSEGISEAFDGLEFDVPEIEEVTESVTEFTEPEEFETDITEPEMPAQTFDVDTDQGHVHVEADAGAFPAGTQIHVQIVNDDETIASITDAAEQNGKALVQRVFALDITFTDASGLEVQPSLPIRVSMTDNQAPDEKEETVPEPVLVHVDHEGEAALLDSDEVRLDVKAEDEQDGLNIGFDAESFSVYAVAYTVEFRTVDGGMYSVLGGRSLRLSEVLEHLSEDGKAYSLENIRRIALGGDTAETAVMLEASDGDYASDEVYAADGDYEAVPDHGTDNTEGSLTETPLLRSGPYHIFTYGRNDYQIRIDPDDGAEYINSEKQTLAVTFSDGRVLEILIAAAGMPEVSDHGVTISAADGTYLPDEAQASAAPVEESQAETAKEAVEEIFTDVLDDQTGYQVFDISLEGVNAEEYADGFRVNVQLPEEVQGSNFRLYHIHEGEDPVDITDTLQLDYADENTEASDPLADPDQKGSVRSFSFVTDSFSDFVLTYTVDFAYELDGKVYTFSMPGGEKMLFSEIICSLGVCDSLPEAELFSSRISNMVFSDESLLRVTSVDQNSQIAFNHSKRDNEDELTAAEDELTATEELIAAEDEDHSSEAFASMAEEYMVIHGKDWLVESLAPFSSEETLTITFEDGQVFTVKVTDAQYGTGDIEIGNDGVVSLTDLATISATCQSNTTDVAWDAQIDFLLRYVFTEDGVSAVTNYVRRNHKSPTIVYDFSSIFDQTALNSVVGASYYLSTGSKTVGRLTVSEEGRVSMTFSDLGWLMDRNSLRGTFNLDLLVDEDEAKNKTGDTVTFPGTTTGTEITYRDSVSNASKSLGWPNSVENEDGSITIFYNASIDANTALDSLHFYDEITAGGAIIDADSVRVNGNAVTGLSNGTSIDFEIANVSGISRTDENKLPAGRYTVSYSATIPADSVAAMSQGDSTTVVNSSHWKVNGTTDVDADPVTYTWTKPITPIPVTKEADKTSIDMTSGTSETVSYTLTFGDPTTPLADFRIADYITDVFTDYSDINVSWDGGSTTLTAGSKAADSSYSTSSVTLFDYTFPSDNTAYGPVTVTYSARTIDPATAKRNGIFDNVNAANTARELRTNNSQTSTTVIKYPERPEISLSKTASIPDEYKNEDGTLKDGAVITYTITIGDSSTDVSDLNITDSMSHLQSVDLSTATIQIGTGAPQSLTTYITSVGGSYEQNWYLGSGSSSLFSFTVPVGENDSEVMGPVVITYTTTVMNADEAHAADIWGEQAVNNTVSAGGKSSTDGGTIDYGEQPKFPVEKTADYTVRNTENGSIGPEDTIDYTVTYGGVGWTLDGTLLVDEMSDIQKLTGSVSVALDQALLRTITWPDGTVWEADGTSFTMPAGSSQWAGDGVVWTDFFDDGQYSLNGSWPRVYTLRLPDGRGEENPYFAEGTQMTVTYRTTIITEEEALASGITGLQNAYNRTSANSRFSQTTVPVQFPDEVRHEPTIQKAFDHWDFDGRNVYWTITVAADTANGSSYPLSDVTVYENVVWNDVQIENNNQQMWSKVIEADAFDMVNAKVVTASGVVLQPGEDYTVFKGQMNSEGTRTLEDPYFHFDTLDEAVTITLCYNIGDNEIIDGFHASNKVRLNNGKDSVADQTYNTNNIDMTKNGGTFDQSRRVIKWIVRINPALKTINPDMTEVIFNDSIPDGLKLINYSAYLNGTVDPDHPSFRVDYVGTVSGQGREYGASGYDLYKGVLGNYTYDSTIYATVTNTAITNANIAAIGVFNNDTDAYMSGQGYVVTYYTYIENDEWNRITSSLTGSKTYENTATVEMDGQDDLDATGYKTIDSSDFIWKEDTTQENSNGIVIDSENKNSNVLSFRIDVNPYARQLVSEEGAMLTLTDRIGTNMDLDTSGDGVTVEYETADGTFVNIKNVGADSEYYALFQAIKVSYNDDTRYVTIMNIPDKIHFRLTYNTVVRAQGTETFENTAVLTGGGSHSASTSEEHTIQKSGGNIAGNTANITLRKIDENDLSTKIVGATFEIYECTLRNPDAWKYTVEVPVISEDPVTHEKTTTWVEEQHFDFNRIEAATPNQWTGYAGNSETEQLKEDFTITGTTILGEVQSGSDGIVHMPDTLKEETLYYWIETATVDGYTAELNVPHYFIVYQVYDDDGNLMETVTQEVNSSGTALAEWQAKQWRGWALDDASQYANSITVASLAAENTWTVNNQESEYTSISATKTWAGDYDNFYETRPEEGIQLKLIQIGSDGTETQYGPIIPINVDDKGNWPTYVWQQLPKTGNNSITYTYRVEEIPVSGYTTTYLVDGTKQPDEGIESGEVTVTNTLIPTKTNISVKKVFDQDGTTYPDQILVYLYEITTSKEDGTTSRAQRSSYALTAAGNWTHTWRNLPTKDDDGNALTYTVVEGAVGDGFSYTVSYSDNGEGITGNTPDDPLVITNTENGLEITKTFGGDAARLMGDTETARAMRERISFTVTDGTNQVSFTVADMTASEDGTYSFKMTSSTYPWLTKGKTVYVQEKNEAFTNTDLVSVSYTVNGGDPVTVTENMETVTVTDYTVTGGLDSVAFTNEYHEDTVNLSVDKKWLNVEGAAESDSYWPEGMTVTFNLTADEGNGAIATGDTGIMTGAGQVVSFENLPKYVLNTDTEIVYSVTETVDGYESSITSRTVDEDGSVHVTVTNQKASPRLYVQKVWRGSANFIPGSLTVDLYESDTEGMTSGGTLKNTITLTAPDWKGYFEEDSSGNKLQEGRYYYIQERGVGGWTLIGYSVENGQAFEDMETITVTNTRNTPPPPGKTSVSVQKKWTVNGEEADAEDWEPVQVQLVRYKAEAPRGVTVKVYYDDNGTGRDPGIQKNVAGTVSIALNYYDIPASAVTYGAEFSFDIYGGDYWSDASVQSISSGSSIDSVTFDLENNEYSSYDTVSVVFGPAWGYLAREHLSPVISGETPKLGDDIVWTGPDDVTYNGQTTFTLDASNSWQYEFTDLDTEGTEGTTKYFYKYTVVETESSQALADSTNSVTTGGEKITVTSGAQVDAGGNVVITNNREYGSITVNKSVLRNNVPDADAAGQTITVGLFMESQENGSTAAPEKTGEITIGSDSTGSVTFEKLTIGPTYYVYEIVDGKVVTDGKTAVINNVEYTASQIEPSAALSSETKTATINITNSRTEETDDVDFEFTKIWRAAVGNTRITWPDGKSITVNILQAKGETDTNPSVYAIYTIDKSDIETLNTEINANNATNDNELPKLKVIGNSESTYTFKLDGLPATGMDNGNSVSYVYYVSEPAAVSDYQTPKYFNSTSQAMGASWIGDSGTIANDQIGYALPSTGGPGTRLYTILGMILTAGAGVLLWKRKMMK